MTHMMQNIMSRITKLSTNSHPTRFLTPTVCCFNTHTTLKKKCRNGCDRKCEGGGGRAKHTQDKSTKGGSFHLPSGRWLLCIIHWLQAFGVGPTLSSSRGGISPQITQVKSKRNIQWQLDTLN